MATSVLIASPTIAFGELIRLTLEGDGNYHVTRVNTGCEALAQCQSIPFELAILDADLSDLPLPDLFTAVQKLRPGIRLILVPPNSDPHNPIVAGLPSHGYLNKPFYLPDLMDIVTRVLQPQDPLRDQQADIQPAGGAPPVPPLPTTQTAPDLMVDRGSAKRPASKPVVPTTPDWLQDVAIAAQHLTRLSLETAALAAMIIRDGKLWAYAGQLAQPAAQELAQTIAHYWERGNGSDLARFVHLDATAGDYMLYATAVSGELALAMVFDIETPFSKIRSQASHLARSLASPPGSMPQQPKEEASLQPVSSSARSGQPVGEGALEPVSLTPLFEDVPPASPGQLSPSQTTEISTLTPPEASEARSPNPQRADEEMKGERLMASRPETVEVSQPAPAEASMHALEPASPAVCNLSYACLMVPRMPQHLIDGDLAARLSDWTRQLCLAYGWRLDQLVVNRDCVAWVMNVQPTASPSTMMRLFRQQTSARIFADFPILGRENPSGDFWAPGYLIMSSGQLPPESLVRDFIKQTRRRQGVS
jgi:REP element-mobilizing transposase RayT/CheY-like chemotaxis protein